MPRTVLLRDWLNRLFPRQHSEQELAIEPASADASFRRYFRVTLGNGVFCGPSCVFTNDLTPRARYPKGHEHFVPTRILDGASIGANATVVCGHIIGKNALIGAGAVVVGNVPDHALMLGVPATQHGFVCTCGKRLEGLKCPACGRFYIPVGEGLAEVLGRHLDQTMERVRDAIV